MSDQPSIIFLTFGNSPYQKSLDRIQKEAKELPFDLVLAYNDEQLKKIPEFWDRHKEFIETNKRGYGYWLWKPFLVWYTLRSMKEGEILVYADAGCELHPKLDLFHDNIKIVKNNVSGILSWTTCRPEKTWTKMDLINYFDAGYLLNKEQLHAAFFMIRCTSKTIDLVKKWYETGCIYHMIDDSPSISQNDITFTEHRHDQSIFSILRNIHGCSDIYITRHFIDDANKYRGE